MEYKGSIITDTLHENLYLSSFEKKILSHLAFNRLHDVYQNSTVYLTFPTNRTKRFEHSLGTMKMCGEIFFYSICNADDETRKKFFNKAKEKVRNIVKKIRDDKSFRKKIDGPLIQDNFAEVYDVRNCEFINENIYKYYTPNDLGEDKFLYIILFQAIRICGMLHDSGHPPYSHVVEGALKEIHLKIKDKPNRGEKEEEFLKIIGETTKPLHEHIGDKISGCILDDCIDDYVKDEFRDDDEKFNR